jgi:hypothetical protein
VKLSTTVQLTGDQHGKSWLLILSLNMQSLLVVILTVVVLY